MPWVVLPLHAEFSARHNSLRANLLFGHHLAVSLEPLLAQDTTARKLTSRQHQPISERPCDRTGCMTVNSTGMLRPTQPVSVVGGNQLCQFGPVGWERMLTWQPANINASIKFEEAMVRPQKRKKTTTQPIRLGFFIDLSCLFGPTINPVLRSATVQM